MTQNITNTEHDNALQYAECRYAECRILVIVMLSAIMLSVIMLNVVPPTKSVTKLIPKMLLR